VERRKEVAMAWTLGLAQDAVAGTQRGRGECREDVAAARVLGATQASVRERGDERNERGIRRSRQVGFWGGDYEKLQGCLLDVKIKYSLGVYRNILEHVYYSIRTSWTVGWFTKLQRAFL
jgi:hypothetical protein